MKAVQILGDKASPTVVFSQDVPQPRAIGSRILVQVYAAGITGDEITWPEVYQSPSRIPGHELSGTIAALGPDYHGGLHVGQEVWALIRPSEGQAQAEYIACGEQELCPKPAGLTHAEAAVLPIPLLTAWEALIDHGNLLKGQTVLVTGASGAVGRMVVQVANLLEASEIVVVASPKHHDTLRELGATQALDYHTAHWEQGASRMDLLIDTVGGDMLSKCWDIVKDKGCIVTVGDPAPRRAFEAVVPSESASKPQVRYKYFIVALNRDRLEHSGKLLDQGKLKALPVASFDAPVAVQAWSYAHQRGRSSKAVLLFNGRP